MENSNTLPKIEVGDTVIFRTDLEEGVLYGSFALSYEMENIIKSPQKVVLSDTRHFIIEGHWQRFTPKMVAQVIKPTKERVYTEQEMIDFADKYAEYSYRASMDNRFKPPMSAKEYFQEYIESLNK